jgi:GH25 family lysozyme M1 (1,4-beta-N-acetylmuramidase)
MLLEYKADINKCKDSGESALYIACKGDSPLPTHLFTFVLIFLSNSISTMSKYPFWQAIYKGDAPLSTHLFTFVLIFLSNSFSTMSKYPFWQAIYKGDAPLRRL